MDATSGHYAIAPSLLTVTVGDPEGPVTFVIDLRSGHELKPEPAPSETLRAIQATGSPPPGSEATVHDLLHAGWILPRAGEPGPRSDTTRGPVDTPQTDWTITPDDITVGDRLCALAGIMTALIAPLLPVRYQMRYILATTDLAARCCDEPAPIRDLQRLMAAAYTVSYWWPGRFACLERAHATVIAAALRGYRAYLRIGYSLWPPQRHTWVEADGVPVVRPGELRVTGVFTPMRRG